MERLIAGWVDNPVAANLLMWLLIAGGLLMLPQIRKEEFPNMDLDYIQVTVPYRGAAPEEVEQGVCRRIEEAIEGIEGVRQIGSYAQEGLCLVNVQLFHDADKSKALDDVNARVYAINTFPVETERPVISELTVMTTVMELALAAQTDERSLKELGEQVREELLELPGLSQVELLYARPYEISIEVSEQTLQRHGLGFDRIAQSIREASLDVPGGSVKTVGGEILLRSTGQRYTAEGFAGVPVIKRADGTVLRLGEIADIVDGFEDTDLRVRYDGKPALLLRISRVGEEDTLEIAAEVKAYLERKRAELPAGVWLGISRDESQDLVDRLDALLGNAWTGFLLVVATLALFLRLRIALWVSMGIPVALLGALAVFPLAGLTISSLSLMGMLLVLGIVVDDATVVGERVHARESEGLSPREAAIKGTSEVSIPVVFGVLTTMAAFLPIITLQGEMASFFSAVGVTVVLCLLFSLLESQFILPAHLAAARVSAEGAGATALERMQDRVAIGLQHFVEWRLEPLMRLAASRRYVVFAIATGVLMVAGAMIASGRIVFQYFPSVEGDRLYATLAMPEGTPVEQTEAAARRLEASAEALRSELDRGRGPDEASAVRHVMSSVGMRVGRGSLNSSGGEGGHVAEVLVELAPARERGGISSAAAAARWRELTGPVPDALELGFTAEAFSAGKPVDVELRGADVAELGRAAAELREALSGFDGVHDVTDTYRAGKQELQLRIRPEAETLGLAQRDLGRQVRQAFHGEEVQRVQRGREDLRVMLRLPREERVSAGDLETLRIRTADGSEVPATAVADIVAARGYSTIRRVDGQRVVSVQGEVDRSIVAPEQVLASIEQTEFPRLAAKYPGISFALAGEAEERAEALASLGTMTAIALLLIYALLAIPLHSYVQPLVIMSAIPFGVIGALVGHLVMGKALMFFSLLGIVALSGVVVNASLVLVDCANQYRREGIGATEAILKASVLRFRPVLLTSATTFLGLAPLMATESISTMMFVPLAISLSFGVVFATVVTLFLVPSLYLVVEDLKSLPLRWSTRRKG